MMLRVIAKARADPGFRDVLLSYLDRYLGDDVRSAGTKWVVTEQDLEEFVKSKKLKGLAEKTIHDEVRYIKLALSEVNWVLTPEGIREFLADLAEDEKTFVLKHTTYSLKSFLKTVLKPRDSALFRALYDVFTVHKPKTNNHTRLPTLKQLRLIWQ